MTYQHALRYLSEAQDKGEATLPVSELRSLLEKSATAPILIRFSHDKQANVAARFLRTMLCEAGIGCLHVIESDDFDVRNRFLLNGTSLPPTLLCKHAQALHAREILLRRQPDTNGVAFPGVERTAVLLLRIAAEQDVRVIMIESNDTTLADTLTAFAVPISLTAVSATDAGGRRAVSSIGRSTVEVITHALGAAIVRTLSDACAKSNSRLTVIPRAAIRRREIGWASGLVDTAILSDCRLGAGTALATDAAALALQLVASLRRHELPISDEQARRGLARTVLPAELSPVSIHPLIIADCVSSPAELLLTLREISRTSLPHPIRLCLEPSLALPHEFASLFDEITDLCDQSVFEGDGTTLVIGSRVFLTQMPKKYGEMQKNG